MTTIRPDINPNIKAHETVFTFRCHHVHHVRHDGSAEAKKPQDQEFRRVVVTLKSGEKIDGYLHRGWHAESSFMKKENYSFKLAKTPEDKEKVKYTADDVESVEYVEKTEANPDGIRWEALDIASPGLSDRNRTFRRMVCLNKGRPKRHSLLVENMDDRASGQSRPPGAENHVRYPVS